MMAKGNLGLRREKAEDNLRVKTVKRVKSSKKDVDIIA
jgi:hypothetical protein